jgi:hypothetical protein
VHRRADSFLTHWQLARAGGHKVSRRTWASSVRKAVLSCNRSSSLAGSSRSTAASGGKGAMGCRRAGKGFGSRCARWQ